MKSRTGPAESGQVYQRSAALAQSRRLPISFYSGLAVGRLHHRLGHSRRRRLERERRRWFRVGFEVIAAI